jgi:quercetin dioxygenase-like cupin family protein
MKAQRGLYQEMTSRPRWGAMILSLLVIVAFLCGILVGKHERHPPHGILHGTILHLQDLPLQSTSHVDQQGRPIRKQQFLQPFVIPNFSGFQVATLLAGQTVQRHEHPTMHEIFYVLSGKAAFTVDDKDHIATKGTMIHVAPTEKHRIVAQESDEGDLVMAYFGITVQA